MSTASRSSTKTKGSSRTRESTGPELDEVIRPEGSTPHVHGIRLHPVRRPRDPEAHRPSRAPGALRRDHRDRRLRQAQGGLLRRRSNHPRRGRHRLRRHPPDRARTEAEAADPGRRWRRRRRPHVPAQVDRFHGFTVIDIGIASASKRKVVESTGATFIPSGDHVAARIRHEAPEGVDLILDLVGGDALREVADLVTDPGKIISAADPTTAIELGGTALQRTRLVTRRTVLRRSTNNDNQKDGTMSTKSVQKVADPTPLVVADDPREAIEVGVLMANGKLVGRNFADRAEATAWARPEYGDQVVEFNALCQCDFAS